MCNMAGHFSRRFYAQVQATNRSVHDLLCAPNLALLLSLVRGSSEDASRCAAIEDNVGAKLTINCDMCNVPKSSPEVLFFMKSVLQEYALGMFANLVMS